ncbi:hypothetical protein J7K44_01020 [bacterium]|nr:hypothetical protein [bacterium]
MTQPTITKIKNGKIVLPENLQKSWKGRQVFLFPFKDTLIIKKIQKPLESDWKNYEAKLKKGGKKISPQLIEEAVKWAKTHL